MEGSLPGADICEMYPYTRDGRKKLLLVIPDAEDAARSDPG
jgi:hypothetical protein